MTVQAGAKTGKIRSSGCIPCKARKKKCDGRKPACVGCERNVLLCRWSGPDPMDQARTIGPSPARPARDRVRGQDVVKIRSTPSPSQKRRSFNTPFPLQPSRLGTPKIQHPISLILYEHYLHHTAAALSALRGPHNAFLTELPKLAVRYPDMVLPALLALSGVHYGNMYGNPEVREMAWSHLAQALRALKYAVTRLGDGNRTGEGGGGEEVLGMLVTTLVLSFIEVSKLHLPEDMNTYMIIVDVSRRHRRQLPTPPTSRPTTPGSSHLMPSLQDQRPNHQLRQRTICIPDMYQ